jgi:phosphoserine phosphatase
MDFDSTLMDGETIDFIADLAGIKDQVSAITKEAMEGNLDFFESLTRRVGLLKGIPYDKVDAICADLPYMPGAAELIDEMKKQGYKVMVFSGGFRNATSRAKDVLGFDADFSNVLHHKEGVLTGLVGGDMMFDFSKGDMLTRIQNILGVTADETIVIGDGANDRSMFKYAAKKVAFCAHEILKKEANIVVDKKDLREVINYL